MKIKIIKSFRPSPHSDHLNVGDELEARVLPGALLNLYQPYQIIDGKHSGQEVPVTHCIKMPVEKTYTEQQYTALKQENLQRLEEVKEMQRRVESLTKFSNQKVKDVRRLNDEVSKAWIAYGTENEAKVLLEATLERAMLDHQPVVLPREVAEAIDHCISVGFVGFRIISCIPVVSQLFRDYQASTIEALKVLRNFAFTRSDGEETLLKALVSGYTVEQTLEESNKSELKKKDEEFIQHCKFYFEQDMFLGDFLSQVKDLAKKTYSK